MNIFMISGWDRTGSTLLLRLLDGHPDLYVHPEAGFDFQQVDRLMWPDFSIAIRDRNFNMAFETSTTPPLRKLIWESKLGRIEHSKYNDQLADFDFDFDSFLSSWRMDLVAEEEWSDELILRSFFRRYFECLKSHPQTSGQGYVFSQSRIGFDYERFFQIFPQGKLILTRRNLLTRLISWMGLGRELAKPGILNRPRMPMSLARDLWRLYQQAQQQKFQDQVIEETKHLDSVFVCDYEDLLSDSETMMQRLAKFLDLPFNQILLSPTVYGQPWLSNSSFGRPTEQRGKIDPGRLQRSYWTNTDKKIIETIYRYAPVPTAVEVVSSRSIRKVYCHEVR